MNFVPWRQISNWKCAACGECCRSYGVVLSFPEWLAITKTFGTETTVTGIQRFCIRRGYDGSCAFLCRFGSSCVCGLQHMKPDACKLWPFKIMSEPEYGLKEQAYFEYGSHKLFVYADTNCHGLKLGNPNWDFNFVVLREFVEIALGKRRRQNKTTSTFFV